MPDKLCFKSKKCIFLGFSSNHRGYRCFDPLTQRVYLSPNVVFDEGTFPTLTTDVLTRPASEFLSPASPVLISLPQSLSTSVSIPHVVQPVGPTSLAIPMEATSPIDVSTAPALDVSPVSTASDLDVSPAPDTHAGQIPLALPMEATSSSHATSSSSTSGLEDVSLAESLSPTSAHIDDMSPLELSIATNSQPSGVGPCHSMQTRSKTGSLHPKQFQDYQLFYSTKHPLHALHSVVQVPTPTCYSQAVKSVAWRQDM